MQIHFLPLFPGLARRYGRQASKKNKGGPENGQQEETYACSRSGGRNGRSDGQCAGVCDGRWKCTPDKCSRGGQVIVPSVKSAEETTTSPTITIGENSYDTLEAAAVWVNSEENTSETPVDINITGSGVINLTSAISFSKPVELVGSECQVTIQGCIIFNQGASNSSVTGLKFECGKAFSGDQSIRVVSASNVTISGNEFVISDDSIVEGTDRQFTSIWLSCNGNVATTNTIIENNEFLFTNCPNGHSNVAIALQTINASKHPENTTIKGNTFESTSVATTGNGNAIGIMVMGAEGMLKVGGENANDANTFKETLKDGTSNFQGVTLGGDVANAQIQNNSFDCYIGVHMLRQSWNGQFAGPIKDVTITNNQFDGEYGIYTNSTSTGEDDATQISSPFDEDSTITVSNNSGSAENTNATGYYVNSETTLKQALTDAPAGTVITLVRDITCEEPILITTSDIIIDGQGKYKLSYSGTVSDDGKPENGAFITVQTPAKDVTLKNLTVEASNIKHGIEYYCTEGGSIEGVTVKGGAWTSIQANGAQDLTIDGCTTDPSDGAYANIEYCMGQNVTKIPTIEVSNMKSSDSTYPLIYMDQDTINSMIQHADPPITIPEDATSADKAARILDYINTNNLVTVDGMKLVQKEASDSTPQNPKYVIVTAEEPKPSTPSTGGGSSTTQKPLEGIALSMTSAQVGPGDTLQMNVTYTPSDTTASKRVTWTSSDEDVVTVDRNGKVTATGKSGKATITATVGGKTATCTITINPFKVDVEDLNGAVTSCKADGSTVIKVPQSMSYNFDISSGVTLDSFDYTVGNDKVGGTNTITRWNGTSGKYQIYAAGAVGSQTGVYVNGVKLFTIEVTERPFTSDTTLDMSLKVGTPYMFRITPDNKNASFTFLTADGKALSTSYKAALYPDAKGDYYCTVTPLQANRDIGVYCVIGGNTYKVFTVHTIA